MEQVSCDHHVHGSGAMLYGIAAEQVHSPPWEPPTVDMLYCHEVVDPLASETWECFAKLPHGPKCAMEQVGSDLHAHGSEVMPNGIAAQQVHNHPLEPPPTDMLYCLEVVGPLASETWECFAKLPHGPK